MGDDRAEWWGNDSSPVSTFLNWMEDQGVRVTPMRQVLREEIAYGGPDDVERWDKFVHDFFTAQLYPELEPYLVRYRLMEVKKK